MKLYEHQKKALDETKNFNRVAYYLDMGLGKTFVGSEKLKELGCNLNLLVCQKSKINDWIEHFKTHYPQYNIYNLTNKIDMPITTSIKIIGIINYELIFRRQYLLELKDFTLILDESSMIQNDLAKRSKFILKMKPKNVILLSGTPTSGKYENLWSQSKLLGWDISKNLYNDQYVNWRKIDVGGVPIKIVDKEEPYKNIQRLKSKLNKHGAIFMKTEECFQLPKQIFSKIFVEQTKEYRKFQKNGIITIDNKELIGDTNLSKRLYLKQLCGHYNKHKLQAFKDLIFSTEDRLIVFYNYTEELNVLKDLSKEKPVSIVNGFIKDLNAYENESNSITFVQYQAGSMGLNLQKSNKIIYFTLPDNSELFEQSKKRTHRIGQTQTCFYYLLLVKNSIEIDEILENLNMRKEYMDSLFDKEGETSGKTL